MENYKLETWKLRVEGFYETEEAAIKDLADQYMQCSHCDAPGDHPLELWAKAKGGTPKPVDVSIIGKGVCFSIEMKIFGIKQWVMKERLTIHPFQVNHWWPCEGFVFEPCEFRYEIYPKK